MSLTNLFGNIYIFYIYFISAGEKIAGIIQQPESLQGMRENLDRVLQFMASKKVRMHQISSREILEGNLKAVMRLILALAAHYKPASVKHHDVSSDNVPDMDKTPGAAEHQAPVDRRAQGERRGLSWHYQNQGESVGGRNCFFYVCTEPEPTQPAPTKAAVKWICYPMLAVTY